MKFYSVTIQMKAIEQYFLVVVLFVLYMVVLTFEHANKILKCDSMSKLGRKIQ